MGLFLFYLVECERGACVAMQSHTDKQTKNWKWEIKEAMYLERLKGSVSSDWMKYDSWVCYQILKTHVTLLCHVNIRLHSIKECLSD